MQEAAGFSEVTPYLKFEGVASLNVFDALEI